MQGLARSVGRFGIGLATQVGGVSLVGARTVRCAARGTMAFDEVTRALFAYGVASLPILLATAAFTGMIMVIQAAVYVRQFGAHSLVGWFAGFTTLREVGPILMGLMFSGRVGANHTSELATMQVTEQLDALRILALDVYDILIAPRTIAMIIALVALVIFGDMAAIVAGAFCARVLIKVDFGVFLRSFLQNVTLADLLVGLYKAAGFGATIAVISSYFGLAAQGGSRSVGRAVHKQVVASAAGLFLIDYLVTSVAR